MYRLQTAELLRLKEQEIGRAEARLQEVLQVVQETHHA